MLTESRDPNVNLITWPVVWTGRLPTGTSGRPARWIWPDGSGSGTFVAYRRETAERWKTQRTVLPATGPLCAALLRSSARHRQIRSEGTTTFWDGNDRRTPYGRSLVLQRHSIILLLNTVLTYKSAVTNIIIHNDFRETRLSLSSVIIITTNNNNNNINTMILFCWWPTVRWCSIDRVVRRDIHCSAPENDAVGDSIILFYNDISMLH